MTGIIIPNNGTIGSASDTDAISISSTGAVTLSSDFVPATPLSHRNMLINGAMQISQRGSSFTGFGAAVNYSLDRFFNYHSSDGAFTISQESSVVPTGFKNSLKILITTADASLTASQRLIVGTRCEGQLVSHLSWGTSNAETVTLSFYVRSSITGTHGGAINNGSDNRSYPFTYTISSADTWERKSITIAGDQTGTWATDSGRSLQVVWGLGAGTSFSASAGSWVAGDISSATGATTAVLGTENSTWYLSGVQLELGNVATPFEHRSFPDELRRCQRYYERTYPYGTAIGSGSSSSASYAGALYAGLNGTGGQTTGWLHAQFRDQVEKRAVPTTTMYDTAGNAGKLSITIPGTSTTHDQTVGTGDVSTNSISIFRAASGTSAASFYCHLLRDAEFY